MGTYQDVTPAKSPISLKATFHYAIQVTDLVCDLVGRRPVASWNLAYHALSNSLAAS